MVDVTEGILGIDWIEGQSIRKLIPGGTEDDSPDDFEDDNDDGLKEYGVSVGSWRKIYARHFLIVRPR